MSRQEPRGAGDATLTASDAGLVLHGRLDVDATHDVLINGQLVMSVKPGKDMKRDHDGLALRWPPALRPYLNGTATIELLQSDAAVTVARCRVQLGDERPQPVTVRDRQDNALVLDKWGRLTRPLALESAPDLQHLLQRMSSLLALLREECGVSAFLCFGTLLGAVRDQAFVGHDNDVDLAYASLHGHPADIIRESYRVERRLVARGWKVRRGSAVRLNIRVQMPSGLSRFIDVFAFSEVEGELYMPSDAAVRMPAAALLPVEPVRLYDRTFPAPARPESLLEAIYGAGWRVPDPSFRYEPSPRLKRRYEGWYGGLHPHRKHWESFARRHTPEVATGPSRFAEWVGCHRGADAGRLVDIGAGTGRDSLYFASHGSPALGLDYVARWVSAARKRAQHRHLPAEFRQFNLADIREAFSLGGRLSGEPCDLYARLLLSSISAETRENLWRLARLALRRRGRLYLEFRTTEDAARPHVFDDAGLRRRYLDPEDVTEEIGRFGGRVALSVSGEGMAPFEFEDPHLCRMVVTWSDGAAAARRLAGQAPGQASDSTTAGAGGSS